MRAAINVALDDAQDARDKSQLQVIVLKMKLENQKEELALTREESRLAQEEANATTTQLRTELETLSAHASSMETSNTRLHKKHEDLKDTCRRLISLVEGFEAAGKHVDDVDAFERLHRKYTKMKGENEKLRTKLQKVESKKSRS
ncbi:hypothetical protein K438DRAFT_358182 [Mycena galopus ATCC 62051]|nr:hypothetical protein K438DRAFT_358182 [Mycena galopus ATCC 62051]